MSRYSESTGTNCLPYRIETSGLFWPPSSTPLDTNDSIDREAKNFIEKSAYSAEEASAR